MTFRKYHSFKKGKAVNTTVLLFSILGNSRIVSAEGEGHRKL